MEQAVVFVVTNADPYEREIYGIFSSRERAEQFIAERHRPERYAIDEYNLDEVEE